MKDNHIQSFVHDYLKSHVDKTDIVVDATVGNGHDTYMLSTLAKHVFGFDIQHQAILNTNSLLESNPIQNVTLFEESFIHILDRVQTYKGIVFNLGYLPSGDKNITTLAKDTVPLLKELLKEIKENQFIIITCYPGHPEGKLESDEITHLAEENEKNYLSIRYQIMNRNNAPFVIIFEGR